MKVSKRLRRYLPDLPCGIAHDRIYAALKQALIAGEFAPSDKMTVRGLAEAFGTSPMPVREALRRLIADQALVQQTNRGIIVPPVSVERLLDLRRVRIAVEGLAAEWAASTITDAELSRLEALQADMRAMESSGESSDYLAANKEFHFTVYRAARSSVLVPVIESLWLQAGPYLTIMRSASTLGMGLDHHARLLSALHAGDGRTASQAVGADIAEAAEVMLRASTHFEAARRKAA
jgi:DNA-binding GntR family transcriptional regulator